MVPKFLTLLLSIPAIFILFSVSESRPLPRSVKENSVARLANPMCEPSTLDPAIDCGCYVYSCEFLEDDKWSELEDLCLDELNGDIESGYNQCPYTDFMESGEVQLWMMNEFFEEAKETCTYDSTSDTARYIRHSIGKRSLSMFGLKPVKNSRGKKTSSRFDDKQIKISPAQRTRSRFGRKSTNGNRIPLRIAHDKMVNFCFVISFRKRLPKDRAYRMCCPFQD